MNPFGLPAADSIDGLAGEFVLIGIQRESAEVPRALLATEGEWGLKFAGSVELDLPKSDLARLWRAVERLRCDYPHLSAGNRAAEWLKPELRIRIGNEPG
jgi:hypothetical protein